MKIMKLISAVGITSLISISIHANAEGLIGNLSQSASHAGIASEHSLSASGQAIAGISAIPLLSVGTVGKVSNQIGEDLWGVASGNERKGLDISDHVPTIGPSPAELLDQQD